MVFSLFWKIREVDVVYFGGLVLFVIKERCLFRMRFLFGVLIKVYR